MRMDVRKMEIENFSNWNRFVLQIFAKREERAYDIEDGWAVVWTFNLIQQQSNQIRIPSGCSFLSTCWVNIDSIDVGNIVSSIHTLVPGRITWRNSFVSCSARECAEVVPLLEENSIHASRLSHPFRFRSLDQREHRAWSFSRTDIMKVPIHLYPVRRGSLKTLLFCHSVFNDSLCPLFTDLGSEQSFEAILFRFDINLLESRFNNWDNVCELGVFSIASNFSEDWDFTKWIRIHPHELILRK